MMQKKGWIKAVLALGVFLGFITGCGPACLIPHVILASGEPAVPLEMEEGQVSMETVAETAVEMTKDVRNRKTICIVSFENIGQDEENIGQKLAGKIAQLRDQR